MDNEPRIYAVDTRYDNSVELISSLYTETFKTYRLANRHRVFGYKKATPKDDPAISFTPMDAIAKFVARQEEAIDLHEKRIQDARDKIEKAKELMLVISE